MKHGIAILRDVAKLAGSGALGTNCSGFWPERK